MELLEPYWLDGLGKIVEIIFISCLIGFCLLIVMMVFMEQFFPYKPKCHKCKSINIDRWTSIDTGMGGYRCKDCGDEKEFFDVY